MRAMISLPIFTLCLAACATLPATQRTPFLPAGVYGIYEDNDIGAINQSAWAFASPANTRGNPAEAAKAVVALEFLSGELRENPRWVGMDASVKLHIGRARDELRQILGIRPDAAPQVVVNTLLALGLDLQTGNQAAAMQVLSSPIFTQPPDRTLQVLSNLPYVQEANLATSRAEGQSFPPGGVRG
ncbi:MAG: hypothetical protein QOG25_3884 [Acetobacteraceae bacterium]|nr:hypothetical protein [Acetobacteraceae bacterium]